MSPRTRIYLAVLCLTVALDQGTKALARHALMPRSPSVVTVVPGLFELQYAENRGAAFHAFADPDRASRALLIGVAFFGVLLTASMVRRLDPDQRALAASLALIGGGALGNLVDRLALGAVTDFILWRVGPYRWPNFNLADAALVVGGALLIIAGYASSRVGTRVRGAA